MTVFLGIDGGQSSTTSLIGDAAGRVIGIGRGGPCNHVGAAEGRSKFLSAVGESVAEACAQAGLGTAKHFASVCAGFSGGPDDKEQLLGEIFTCDRSHVTTDARIALTGATAGEPGMIAIAGTGSIAYGQNASGKFARAGGWGYVFGDEGGAFDIVRQALRAALRYEEGWGPDTVLRERLLEATGARDSNDLLHRFYTTAYPRSAVASYARLVDEVAGEGDPVARSLILNAAQQLATTTSAVRHQLFEEGEEAKVAYIGGVFRSRLLLERYSMLVELEYGNRVIAPLYEPAAGALILAYQAAGLNVTLSNAPSSEK